MIAPHVVSRIVGCTRSYARTFEYVFEEQIVRERVAINQDVRDHILGEDGHKCLRCYATGNLHIHHIIPVSDGGETTRANLATLCQKCHRRAHGDRWADISYNTVEEFWHWVRS